jgi:hypothetical protein
MGGRLRPSCFGQAGDACGEKGEGSEVFRKYVSRVTRNSEAKSSLRLDEGGEDNLFSAGIDFGGGGRVALPPAKEERCFVDEDSDQPAFEGAFAAESWWVSGGRETAVFDCLFGFLGAVEDALGYEIKQTAVARELQIEGALGIFCGFAVGFEVAASDGNVEVPDGLRGGGEEFWGGVCHKHVSVLPLV